MEKEAPATPLTIVKYSLTTTLAKNLEEEYVKQQRNGEVSNRYYPISQKSLCVNEGDVMITSLTSRDNGVFASAELANCKSLEECYSTLKVVGVSLNKHIKVINAESKMADTDVVSKNAKNLAVVSTGTFNIKNIGKNTFIPGQKVYARFPNKEEVGMFSDLYRSCDGRVLPIPVTEKDFCLKFVTKKMAATSCSKEGQTRLSKMFSSMNNEIKNNMQLSNITAKPGDLRSQSLARMTTYSNYPSLDNFSSSFGQSFMDPAVILQAALDANMASKFAALLEILIISGVIIPNTTNIHPNEARKANSGSVTINMTNDVLNTKNNESRSSNPNLLKTKYSSLYEPLYHKVSKLNQDNDGTLYVNFAKSFAMDIASMFTSVGGADTNTDLCADVARIVEYNSNSEIVMNSVTEEMAQNPKYKVNDGHSTIHNSYSSFSEINNKVYKDVFSNKNHATLCAHNIIENIKSNLLIGEALSSTETTVYVKR